MREVEEILCDLFDAIHSEPLLKSQIDFNLPDQGTDFLICSGGNIYLIETWMTLLMHATSLGMIDLVTVLIEQFHVDMELPTINRETAVCFAARSANERLLDYFMSKRAAHTSPNVWGETPFSIALKRGIDLDLLLPELPPSRGTNFKLAASPSNDRGHGKSSTSQLELHCGGQACSKKEVESAPRTQVFLVRHVIHLCRSSIPSFRVINRECARSQCLNVRK